MPVREEHTSKESAGPRRSFTSLPSPAREHCVRLVTTSVLIKCTAAYPPRHVCSASAQCKFAEQRKTVSGSWIAFPSGSKLGTACA